MKPNEYIREFNLSEKNYSGKISHNQREKIVKQLESDFNNLLLFHTQVSQEMNFELFKRLVSQLKDKFDSVRNKSILYIEEKLWNYFYATVISVKKEEMFGDYLRQRAKDQEYDRIKRNREFYGYSFYDHYFDEFLKNLLHFSHDDLKILNSKKILGLSEHSTIDKDDIIKAFRKKVKIYHPDIKVTGDNDIFIKLCDAKDLLLKSVKTGC